MSVTPPSPPLPDSPDSPRPPVSPGLLDEPMPPLRLWLDPRGRIDRATFWRHGVLALFGLALLLRALLDIARMPSEQVDEWVSLLLAWPLLAISAKRWHDRDRSAWWVLLLLLPVVGVFWLLADNGFVRGTPGRNRFGPPPADDQDFIPPLTPHGVPKRSVTMPKV